MNDLISVIVPVYNVEKYLRQSLDSVLAQTLSEIEIICVDDGSTDGSYDILEEYAAKDQRITVLKQQKCRRRCCQKSWNERGTRRISDVPGFR